MDSVLAKFQQWDATLTEYQRETQTRAEMSTLQATLDAFETHAVSSWRLRRQRPSNANGSLKLEPIATKTRTDIGDAGINLEDPKANFGVVMDWFLVTEKLWNGGLPSDPMVRSGKTHAWESTISD